MPIALPTLSTFGWVTNVPEKMDFALVHFFYADKSQTSLYGQNVSSIQWILEENAGNMSGVAVALSSALNNYLRRYYDAATVDVSYEDSDPLVSSSRVLVTLAIEVVENGIAYQASRLVTMVDGRFKDFTTLNNETADEN